MRRAGFFAALILLTVIMLTVLWPFFKDSKRSPLTRLTGSTPSNLSSTAQTQTQRPPESPPPNVSAAILREAERSGQIDRDPQATELRLDDLASNLSSSEVQQMADIGKTPSNDGDLRSLAVELLVRNKKTDSLKSLEDVILSRWPASADPRMVGFEQALRARAIEGLEQHPSEEASSHLEKALANTEDPFLRDHAERANRHRKGEVRSVEDQDEEALKKVISR